MASATSDTNSIYNHSSSLKANMTTTSHYYHPSITGINLTTGGLVRPHRLACTISIEYKLQMTFTIEEKLLLALIFLLFGLITVNCSTEDSRVQMVHQSPFVRTMT